MELTLLEEDLKKQLKEETKRCGYWEKTAKDYTEKYETKMRELEEAHAIIGRVTHQLSKRWDTVPVTKYMKDLLVRG